MFWGRLRCDRKLGRGSGVYRNIIYETTFKQITLIYSFDFYFQTIILFSLELSFNEYSFLTEKYIHFKLFKKKL